DSTTETSPNFHLYFLLRLTKFLCIYPAASQDRNQYFDLKDVVFCGNPPFHQLYLNEKETEQWSKLLASSFNDLTTLHISLQDRRELLNRILEYYALHMDSFGNIKSHYILEEVFG